MSVGTMEIAFATLVLTGYSGSYFTMDLVMVAILIRSPIRCVSHSQKMMGREKQAQKALEQGIVEIFIHVRT